MRPPVVGVSVNGGDRLRRRWRDDEEIEQLALYRGGLRWKAWTWRPSRVAVEVKGSGESLLTPEVARSSPPAPATASLVRIGGTR
jgi:hypothetical protein